MCPRDINGFKEKSWWDHFALWLSEYQQAKGKILQIFVNYSHLLEDFPIYFYTELSINIPSTKWTIYLLKYININVFVTTNQFSKFGLL